MSAFDGLREVAEAAHITDGEAAGVVVRDLRAAVAEHDALRAERDVALARLGAVRDFAAHRCHGEECPAGEHEECDEGCDGVGCEHGLSAGECGDRKADCACGRDRLWALVAGEPASDARTLGEARSTAERARALARHWKKSAEGHAEFSARFQREAGALRDVVERQGAALRVVALWLGGPHHNPQPDAVEELARAKGREMDALRAALGAAAAGELPRCETCGERLATRQWKATEDRVCDRCFDEDAKEARAEGEAFDAADCVDLPQAGVLRAALAPSEAGAMRAVGEGRTDPPTDAEIAAHADRDNGGAWLVRGEVAVLYFDDGELFVQVAEHTYGHNPRRPDEARMWLAARAAEGAVWVPLFDDRPCAWPTAEAPRG